MEIASVTNAVSSVTHGMAARFDKSIEELACEIEARSDRSDDNIVEISMLAKQLKARVEAGEAGKGVRFLEWALVRFGRQKSQVYRLLTIANSGDPKRALEDFRVRENERQKKCRKRLLEKVAERKELPVPDPERGKLCEWAARAKIEKVRAILLLIEKPVSK
ncbi:MAG: hypothetical protein WBQ17_10355 [Rhizomicrobium sp.]